MGFPHGHWETTTPVAGLRPNGMAAPLAIVLGPMADNGSPLDGPINGDWLKAYVAELLAPTLPPAASWPWATPPVASAAVRKMIEAKGARLAFFPPYSPDFNPIEMAFAKLKAPPRKAAERTVDGLGASASAASSTSSRPECANHLAAAGYDAD